MAKLYLHEMKGDAPFIVIEGPDGAGTTTLAKALAEIATDHGYETERTCEPSDGQIGTLARRGAREGADWGWATFATLFHLDRLDHLRTVIVPCLRHGRAVICDRYYVSTLVYQGVQAQRADDESPQMGVARVARLIDLQPRMREPDLLIFVQTPLAVCAERMAGRVGVDAFEVLEFQERVHAAYQRLFAGEEQPPRHVHVVDGTAAPEDLAQQCWRIVAPRFAQWAAEKGGEG